MAMIELVPAPIQTMKIGPRAVFGSAFKTTRYGSRTRESVSLHHSVIAIKTPSSVPSRNPTTVSMQDAPRWTQRSPD